MASLLTLEVLSGYTRPVFSLKDNITCLVDSGADTPVWTQGAERFMDVFQVEKVEGKKFLLSGFGVGYEIVDVYDVKDLALSGEGEEVVFKSITVACASRPAMVADLILPNTAFNHMNLTLRNLDVDYPVIEIEHQKKDYYVNPVFSAMDESVVERVYSFANE